MQPQSISYYSIVIEGERGQAAGREDLCRKSIGPGLQGASSLCQVGYGDDMPPWVSPRIGVDPHESLKLDLKAGLLHCLSMHGILHSLAHLNEASRKGVATLEGRVLSLYEHNP